jgi:hypothetical protein
MSDIRIEQNRIQCNPASHSLLLTEEIMDKADKAAPKKEEPVAEPNHTEKIKSQVLAKIGKPPRLHRVEVSRHHGRKYRVNLRESARAKIRVMVRRILNKHGYPPDLRAEAVKLVLEQAEALCAGWVG